MMIHEGLLVILLFTISFALSASQYSDSPQNIETSYPSPSPAPATATPYVSPPPPPPQPPSPSLAPKPASSSRTKKVMTVVGVTAASVLAAAALVVLLVSRWSKSRRSNQNGNEATTTREAEETKMDEEGLDVKYWNELQKTVSASASRVHPLPAGDTRIHQIEHQPPPTHLVDVSLVHSQYSGDIVGALFGTIAGNRENSDPDAKVFILDPLKSREMTAVLTSLEISEDDLIAALLRGKGVNAETLNKLISIAPTSDEQSRILAFDDDPSMLAHAESFLYTLLKAFPSAFTRIQWRLEIDSDMVERVIKPLQILESGCDELRNRDTFLKLLQAVHNTAARLRSESDKMTGFDVNTIGKLSEYRSTDGTTTLLQFVVHQVVRNEGRRCVLNRSNSISRQNRPVKEDKEREFLMMGLPIVGGLSSEFSSARKAGEIDYDGLKDSLASLVNRVKEAMPPGGAGGGFVESADLDIKAALLEHKRVINLVKKVAQYYQAGDSNPVQLFVIVKEFLTRIDQACVEIARSLQQHSSTSRSDLSQPDVLKTRVNFHRLPPDFFSS